MLVVPVPLMPATKEPVFGMGERAILPARSSVLFFFLALAPPPSSPDHQIGYIDVRGAPSNARYTALV